MSVMAFAVASSLLFGFLVAIIWRYCLRQNVRGSGGPVLFHMRVDSIWEDDHGCVNHPIWLINTTGLDQSAIESIAVCEFKKGDELIYGTECTVFLGEFEEGEDLQRLPKCSHAFHVPCIDTWFRSHKNYTLCRAPMVRDVPSSAMVSGNVDAGERNSEGESGSRGEKRTKGTSLSIGSSSVTETRRTTAIDKHSWFAKEAKTVRDAVCRRKNGESSWNKIRRSSSDAGKPTDNLLFTCFRLSLKLDARWRSALMKNTSILEVR